MLGSLHAAPKRRGRLAVFVACFLTVLIGATALPSSPAAAYTTVIYNGAGPGVPRISVIGDSVGSGIRWTRSYAPLTRFNFTFDAESCRRTILPSCGGREGYAPENVLTTMRRLDGRLGEVLVLMTGYNDPGTMFGAGVDAVMTEAARQGVHKVVWLTMRTAGVSYVSPEYRSSSTTFRDNNRILLLKALQYEGRLQVADWATYSAAHPSWVGSDGVHLSVRGAPIAAAFIADAAARVLDGTTITPPAAPVGLGASAASNAEGRISTFAVGQNEELYGNDFDGTRWGGWWNLGGVVTSTPAVVSATPGTLDVFARGADYALWTRHFDGRTWSPWTSLGGVLRSAPAVTSRSPGTIDVFAVGADRALWAMGFDGQRWHDWATLGGYVSATPSATSTREGNLTVFARGGDNALWVNSWNGSWSGWSSLGGALTTAPASASRRPDTVEVFARGGDNALWTNRFDGQWTGWFSLGGTVHGPPAAVAFAPNALAVFAPGTDRALWSRLDPGQGFLGWSSLGGVLR